jgi:hypothetical protein
LIAAAVRSGFHQRALLGDRKDPVGLPSTRDTACGDASAYRSLLAFLGEHVAVEDLTPEAVRAYRDALKRAERTPATIAKHLSAIRGVRRRRRRT